MNDIDIVRESNYDPDVVIPKMIAKLKLLSTQKDEESQRRASRIEPLCWEIALVAIARGHAEPERIARMALRVGDYYSRTCK